MTQVRITPGFAYGLVVKNAVKKAKQMLPGVDSQITRLSRAKQFGYLKRLAKARKRWTIEERDAWRAKMGLPPWRPRIKFGKGARNKSQRKVTLPGSKFLEQSD